MESLARATGLGEAALRLLVGVLVSYPFSIGFTLLKGNELLKHLWSAAGGIWIAWFCYGVEKGGIYHSLGSVILTYLLLLVIPNRKISLTIAFIGNLGHLLFSYYNYATESYDIDFTTAQCVLTLRLIGFAFDYYDGAKADKDLERDQKENRLVKLPPIYEVFGYAYFFGSFMVGPQFPFKHYKSFITEELYRKGNNSTANADSSSSTLTSPSPYIPALKAFLIGLVYLGIHTIGSGYYPSSYLSSDEFAYEISFFEKLVAIWFCCKFALMKYVGIWMLAEGGCILCGIGFNGYDSKGVPQWNALSNMRPLDFETCLNLHAMVDTFNINTNDWMKRYCFKRLRFVGNKHVSSITTLLLLAIWHGLYTGYFLCFILEFIDMEAENRVMEWNKVIYPKIEKNFVLRNIFIVFCWVIRTSVLHYGLVGFEVKSLSNYIKANSAVYFIGHIIPVMIILAHPYIRKAISPKKNL